jgi:predicted Ser/Thr protein kinase
MREIGRGGFGRVYEARTDDDLLLRVAIKVLDGVSPESVQRFHTERSILAHLQHPNIARYIDSGVFDHDRPWIAMEFVEGLPLDRYCERERPSIPERIRIFRTICEAVQAAHDLGVWHLDLKPDNILITLEGQPKLLDFGIAKVSERSLAAARHPTDDRGALTYLYSSPEQLRREPLSGRSDVYNLGLILYELLTGTPARRWITGAAEAALREALSEDPEPPSLRVDRLSRSGTALSKSGPLFSGRTTFLRRGSRPLRGDLDNIVMMALRREPARRYASPQAIAEDLERHLASVPVEARRASLGYRFARSLQRHRVAVAIAGLVLLASAAGTAAMWNYTARRDAERLAAQEAQIRSLQEEQFELLARKYRGYVAGLGWLELDFSEPGADPIAVIGAQADLERSRIAIARQRGSLNPGAVRGHVVTLVRLASACKRRMRLAEGFAAIDEATSLLEDFARVAQIDTEERELRARLLELRGDLQVKAGHHPLAAATHREAAALRERIAADTAHAMEAVYALSKVRQRVFEAFMSEARPDAALATANAMLRERRGLLEEVRRRNDARLIDRFERDLALAHLWRCQALIALDRLDEADADALHAERAMHARLDRGPATRAEPHWDLAMMLEHRGRVAFGRALFAEADALLAASAERLGEALPRSGLDPGCVANAFEIASLRIEIAILIDRPPVAIEVAESLRVTLADLVRGVRDLSIELVFADAGESGLRFELLHLEALLGADRIAEAQQLQFRLRDEIGQALGLAADVPVWSLQLAEAHRAARDGEIDRAARELEEAIAIAAERADALGRLRLAAAAERLAAHSAIPLAGLPRLAEARAAASDLPTAALRRHFSGPARSGVGPIDS